MRSTLGTDSSRKHRIVIVGCGPAGIAAAKAITSAGWRPTVVDEQIAPGGQIYRALAPGLHKSYRRLYGPEARKARQAHEDFSAIRHLVDYFPMTVVWGREGRSLCITRADGCLDSVAFDYLVAGTGATDRQIPVPGWTLPGVYSLGGAQMALKHQLAHIGRRTILAGNGALLYAVAWQYVRSGGSVTAVIDSSTSRDKLHALPAMLAKPGLALRGAAYAAMLRGSGVPVFEGARLRAIEPAPRQREERLAIEFSTRDRPRRIHADAVALGYGLKPESQLAELFDVEHRFDEGSRLWLPEVAADGHTSDPALYMAGDGCQILGADAAALMGERAALALLARLGAPVCAKRISELDRRLATERRFAAALRTAFPVPQIGQDDTPDQTIVCRCEGVTAGQLRRASDEWNTTELNRLKALTRCGMGRCQGRMCGAAFAEIVASHRGVDIRTVGRLRAQMPLKPIPLPASRVD